MADTLFDKYGGFETFSAVVANFYQKVLDCEQLKHYFEGTNMDSLMSHQTNFISKALGGPDKYEGRDLKQVHEPLHISTIDFNEVAELLEEALDESGVEADDVSTIISVIAGLQSEIVSS